MPATTSVSSPRRARCHADRMWSSRFFSGLPAYASASISRGADVGPEGSTGVGSTTAPAPARGRPGRARRRSSPAPAATPAAAGAPPGAARGRGGRAGSRRRSRRARSLPVAATAAPRSSSSRSPPPARTAAIPPLARPARRRRLDEIGQRERPHPAQAAGVDRGDPRRPPAAQRRGQLRGRRPPAGRTADGDDQDVGARHTTPSAEPDGDRSTRR